MLNKKVIVDLVNHSMHKFELYVYNDDKKDYELSKTNYMKLENDENKIFDDEEIYITKEYAIYEKKDDLKLAVILELGMHFLEHIKLSSSGSPIFVYGGKEIDCSNYAYSKNQFGWFEFFISENVDNLFIDLKLFPTYTLNKFVDSSYILDEDGNKLAVQEPLKFPFFYFASFLSSYVKDSKILREVDKFSGLKLDDKIQDNVKKIFSDNISEISKVFQLKLTSLNKKLETSFNAVVKSFIDEFTFNITDLSLNGSNGAKFADGEQVVIEGYSGIWEVVGSIQALVDDNNLTIMYKVRKDKKIMIVPAAFVTNQGA